MDGASSRERFEFFATRCREEGLPLTPQRRVILEALLERGGHPTADEIHQEVVARLPDVSRTTVYRTLEKLVAMGIVTRLSHPGRAVRFDPRAERHHHLTCLRCDAVVDFDDAALDGLALPDTSATGFTVTDYTVELRGLCPRCREEEPEKEESR